MRYTSGIVFILTCASLLFLSVPGYFAGRVYAQDRPRPSMEAKNVLILHAHEANTPVFVETDKGISRTLELGGIPSLNQFFEFLDLRRNGGLDHRKLMVEKMRKCYGHRMIDMIITMYPEALDFVLNDCRDILPVVPILAIILPEGYEAPKTDRRIIVHVPQLDIAGTFEIALKMVPGAKQVFVVNGADAVSKEIENQARRALKKWESRLEIIYLSHLPFDEIVAHISGVSPRSIVLSLAFGWDAIGNNMTTPIVVQRLSEVSPAPIFGVLAYNLSYGIAGGSLVDFERAGARAGRLTLDILSGAIPPEDITGVLDVPPEPMFDWRQLRHWNLDEEALPEGSIVINRETTLWGFKYHMIGVLAFVLAQFVLIGRLWKQTRRRRLVEETLSDRLVFETLLSNISARFVNLPAEEVDREIQQTQRRMCEHLEIDRATLWLISEEDPGNMLLTQIYQPLQIPAPPSLLSANKAFPWCVNRLLRGETVILSKMADLPPEAWRDRESFFTYQTTSVVSVPLSTGKGPVFGCVTFAVTGAERDWTGTTVRGFELIAQVFSNALARKQFETALVESEARLNLATNAAKAGLWVLKIDNRQVWVSPKSRDLFRFAPDEAVDYERYFQVIYPDDRDRVHKAVQKTLDSGVDLKCDFRIVLPDGGIQWIASQGQRHPREKPVCLMGVSFDITERKEVELKFDERLRFEQLFSDMVGRLATVSSADTKSEILRALQETLEFFEFDRIGLVVLSSDRASWESSLAVCAERIEQISLQTNLREALTPWIYDKIFEKRETVSISSLKDLPQEADRDSETLGKWSIQSALFVPVGIGNTVGCVSVTADRRRPAWSDELIARLRLIGNTLSGALARDKAEAEARQHMEEIARMARIATIGELTASLAHEINQPLAAIRSNTEAAVRFLSRAVPDIDEVRQILEDILRDDRRASGVVQKVRNLVKGERSVHALLDLNQLIRDVVGLVKADSLLYGLSITEKLSPDVKPVRGDEAQLEQVLLNLILNSAAAMENAPLNQRRVILGTAMSNNGTARVFVTDFGAGIDENNIARLFDAFYTTKAEGLGLGLSISQRIITEHGGDLTASNNPQGGATFAFTLPIHQGDAP